MPLPGLGNLTGQRCFQAGVAGQWDQAVQGYLASIAGRFITGTTVGALIDATGYVNFYLLTTVVALPGVILFWFMIRSGLADVSIGSAGKEDANSG